MPLTSVSACEEGTGHIPRLVARTPRRNERTLGNPTFATSAIAIGLKMGDTFTINANALGDCDRVGTFSGSGVAPAGGGTTTAGATGTESVVPFNSGTISISFGDRFIYSATAEASIRIQLEDWIFNNPTYSDITVTTSSSHGSTELGRRHLSGLGRVLGRMGK